MLTPSKTLTIAALSLQECCNFPNSFTFFLWQKGSWAMNVLLLGQIHSLWQRGDENPVVFPCVCVCVCVCVLNVWHCETGPGCVCCAWLTKSRGPGAASYVYRRTKVACEREMFLGSRSGHLTHTSSPCVSQPTVSNAFFLFHPAQFFLPMFIHTWSASYPLSPPAVPPSISLPSAQSHHTGSLFLANLSLIHYWGLFLFLESQNKEGERIFWIFNAPHEKCIVSHFATIWTGKLLAGHNSPSHEMTRRQARERSEAPLASWSVEAQRVRGPKEMEKCDHRLQSSQN